MRIIISPAKQMRVDTDTFTCTEVPVFMEKTGILKNWISGLSYEEQIKAFNWSGYHFDEDRSSDAEYVFIRTAISGE